MSQNQQPDAAIGGVLPDSKRWGVWCYSNSKFCVGSCNEILAFTQDDAKLYAIRWEASRHPHRYEARMFTVANGFGKSPDTRPPLSKSVERRLTALGAPESAFAAYRPIEPALHPWPAFLEARATCLVWLRDEQGYDTRTIVLTMAMDAVQVESILSYADSRPTIEPAPLPVAMREESVRLSEPMPKIRTKEDIVANVQRWMKSNKVQPHEVQHGSYPVGFVMTWIHNAQIAEKELAESSQRIKILEAELEQAATALQKVHPIGQVKAIGLREVGLAAEQVAEMLAEARAGGEREREECAMLAETFNGFTGAGYCDESDPKNDRSKMHDYGRGGNQVRHMIARAIRARKESK